MTNMNVIASHAETARENLTRGLAGIAHVIGTDDLEAVRSFLLALAHVDAIVDELVDETAAAPEVSRDNVIDLYQALTERLTPDGGRK